MHCKSQRVSQVFLGIIGQSQALVALVVVDQSCEFAKEREETCFVHLRHLERFPRPAGLGGAKTASCCVGERFLYLLAIVGFIERKPITVPETFQRLETCRHASK